MENLNCKSLMIGDYVNYRGQIIKVTSLYDKGGSNEVGWSDRESVWVNGRCIEPIPLTPEILKKNGFTEQRGSLYVIDKREEYIGICLYRNTMRFTHEVYCSNVEDPDELLYSQELEFESYSYVHELQHLLRLCKIDKEIKL